MTVVDLDLSASSVVNPGPFVYIDGAYRGNPIDARFRISLPVGAHQVRLERSGNDPVLWEETVEVIGPVPPDGIQVVPVTFDLASMGGR